MSNSLLEILNGIKQDIKVFSDSLMVESDMKEAMVKIFTLTLVEELNKKIFDLDIKLNYHKDEMYFSYIGEIE